MDNPHVPPVVLTDFKIFNKSVLREKDSPLNSPISETNEIILNYDQSIFSFEFAALDYSAPEKNQFAYQMEGVDPDWVYTNARHRFATYTQLSPGQYIFKVKASNNDGIWNEDGTSVEIIILPPWWRTTWAYLIYAFLILTVLYSLRHYDIKRQHLKNELALEHEHARKLQEIDRMKSRFFANISHEFRTPLTLILGPIEKWLPKLRNPQLKTELTMMQRNANRLYRLITQLLDLSRLESDSMTLHAREENIIQLIRTFVQSFESLAKIKKISLEFSAQQEAINLYVDKDKIEKVMYNILSNAFKYTPKGGKIGIHLLKTQLPLSLPPSRDRLFSKGKRERSRLSRGDFGGCIEITVTNTGSYIPPEEIDHIFNRFYQVDDSYIRDHEGSGIGLALTKELVELHYGMISVESDKDQGTSFYVWLPLGMDHLKDEEIIEKDAIQKKHIAAESIELTNQVVETTGHTSPGSTAKSRLRISRPIVLIVEDNTDMRRYLKDSLENKYRILEAAEGESGHKIATDKIPDLIISDVMMPKMDGFEFCRNVKTDERISHIPVILLTARAAKDDKIEGLETGADDYISKPFNADVLKARVKNLIEQRRKLRDRFTHEVLIHPQNIAVSSMDEKFIKRSINIIENEMSNHDFTVEKFCREFGMSRSQMHRKIHALTNQSVSQFIRVIRLQRAIQLLEKKAGTVAEISYIVGFNSPIYFNKCFKHHFHMSPMEYISRQSDRV
jgi:signal transduction histidine kinase/DNA-binding response OmpR family regulator